MDKYENYSFRSKGEIDRVLVVVIIPLLLLGVVLVFSAIGTDKHTMSDRNIGLIKTQTAAAFLGVLAMLLLSYVPYQLYKRFSWPIAITALLGLVLVFPELTSFEVHSSKSGTFNRWVQLGGFHFQPVELAKIGVIVHISRFIADKSDRVESFYKGLLPNLLSVGVVFCLLYIQPDFGSAVLIALVALTILFAGGAKLTQLLMTVIIAVGGVAPFVISDDYKMQRINDYVKMIKNPETASYQMQKSLEALSSGKWIGVGAGNSHYKLSNLPEPHTDFVFAIIVEELGFIGGTTLIILFMLLVWRGLYIARNANDKFASLLALGITTQIGLQAVINIGVVTGALPTKGITLPFVSYGGTSMLVSLASIGILLNISRPTKSLYRRDGS